MCGFLWHFLGSPPSISYMVMCPCALSDGAFGALFETLVAAQVPRGKHLVARSGSAVRPGVKELLVERFSRECYSLVQAPRYSLSIVAGCSTAIPGE